MRLVMMSMLVMLAAPRADACPTGTVCAAVIPGDQRSVPRHEIAQVRSTTAPSMVHLAIARASLVRVEQLEHQLATSLRTHVVPRARVIEMPWIWRVLRHNVYARMPRYDGIAERAENRFSLVLSPVVVSSLEDTVPGVGIEGGF